MPFLILTAENGNHKAEIEATNHLDFGYLAPFYRKSSGFL